MQHLTESDLQAWIDGELAPGDLPRVNEHLEACAACRRELGDLRRASEVFSAAMHVYDDDLMPATPPAAEWAPRRAGAFGGFSSSRVGRAAAIFLVAAAAVAAAVVPGSPLRGLWAPGATEAPPIATPGTEPLEELVPTVGASITVRPRDGRLTVRVRAFAPGTRVVVRLTDGSAAVATLPDGAENARFIVASGVLELVGPGVRTAEPGEVEEIEIHLPRTLTAAVVEIDGSTSARVAGGALITLGPVVRDSAGEEAVFDIGG
jgi:hypothetical protein